MRYPGGKTKQVKTLTPLITSKLETKEAYYEPFLGGGSVFKAVLKQNPSFPKHYHLNELNYPLWAYWKAVFDSPEYLVERIRKYQPAVEDFYEWKDCILQERWSDLPIEEIGFRKLALHQISYSGLAELAGSPIGGKNQQSKYTVDCRWNPQKLVQEIKELTVFKKSITVHHKDYKQFVKEIADENTVGYYDPPYWKAGKQLYLKAFQEQDHWDLHNLLVSTKSSWILSYDQNPITEKLKSQGYEDIGITQINTIEGKRKQNRVLKEALIIS